MKKEDLHLRFIRYFYTITGDLDEYSVQEINYFGNNMYMLIYITVFLAIILGLLGFEDLAELILVIGFILPLAKQSALIRRLGLHKLEIAPSELKMARQKMFKRTLLETAGIVLFAILIFLMLWHMKIPQESGDSFETFWYIAAPLASLLITSVSFVCFFITNRRNIVIVED
ncbi:hypothetical protein BU202_04490 [Streptococcus cuniculi]|uniref:DUF3278 domain-containing protein n=1 Tax=Streptococcus cuniculi TaxID=1432788 RepID=A0A1Q8E8Y4_9STRE|nr:DUF3278 domain-containing protein [Streptococcus cuniculi]OLF48255.1 hypothetical protein BU202_04490 [Streptococcus cuniculi]